MARGCEVEEDDAAINNVGTSFRRTEMIEESASARESGTVAGVQLRLILALPFVAGALLPAGCKASAPPPEKAVHDEGVDVTLSPQALEAAHLQTAQPRSVARRASVSVMGQVDFVPSRVARVGPPIAGRVGSIPVVAGQKVGRGATLMTLDSVEVGRARADYVAAKTRLDQTRAESERETRLLAGGATSDRAVLIAQASQAEAAALFRSSEDRLATLGLGTASNGRSVALVSPIAGTVLQMNARVGQPVGTTDTLIVVGETEQVWLEVDLYERDVSKVHVGNEVRVTALAFPDRVFEGAVDSIGTVIDPERRVLAVRIVLSNIDQALKPGMTARARILADAAGDGGTALVVPRHAIQTVDGLPFIFVQHALGKFAMRPVERGAELDDDIEILRGVAFGDTVVVQGSFILKSEALKAQMGAND
jgi:cobalt-zinc-cadmium efflux system membrane fusion protein